MLVAIPWIGKVDTPRVVKAEIIGRIEQLTVVMAGQRGNGAIRFVMLDRTGAPIFAITTDDQPALVVKVHAIGATTGIFPDLGLASCRMIDEDAIVGAVRKVNIFGSVGGRPFGKGAPLVEPFELGIGWDNRRRHGNLLKVGG